MSFIFLMLTIIEKGKKDQKKKKETKSNNYYIYIEIGKDRIMPYKYI